MRTHPGRVAASILTSVATAIVVLAVAVIAFLNPAWVAFEQDRSQVTAWTGFDATEVRAATNAILVDLVIGPPDFDVTVDGAPVLDATERGHMRDVRGVFGVFAVLALAAAAWLVLDRAAIGRSRFWSAVRAGSVGLAVALVAGGAIALLAFDAAFELFHRLFFAGGNWSFDPATSRLVQLFPMQFWFETTIALGVLAVVLAALVAWWSGRRLGHGAAPSVAAARPVASEQPR